jgi:hypothetical protein
MSAERTHWNGCWEHRGHHDCALAEIRRLRADVDLYKPMAMGFMAGANDLHDALARLTEENGRYREALTKIAGAQGGEPT